MDRLTSMAVFAKVAEAGSFAAAAHAVGLSAPMVGKHVRFLEDRLGAQLIHRTTRRQSLTEFGRAYYDRCKLVLAEAAAAEALAGDLLGVPRGPLRVSLPVLFGRHCAAPALLRLAAEHPALELHLSFSDQIVDLMDGRFDLALRNGPLRDSAGLIARRVARQRMVVCAAPAHLAAHGVPPTLQALAAHPAVTYSRSGRAHPWLFPSGDGGPPLEILPNSRLRLDDLEAIADAATAGMGLAWLPCWLARDRIRSGALVPVLADVPGLAIDSHLLWLPAAPLPLRLRLAIDRLAAELPGMMD